VKECKRVLSFKSKYDSKKITEQNFKRTKDQNDLVKMQSIDIDFWLAKDILHKADRMSMANSLEVRVPFIDKDVFDVARKLTVDKKVNKTNTKVALRDAAKTVIPNEAYKKKKLGFPVPLRIWLQDDKFYNTIESTFDEDYAKEFFDREYAKKLLRTAREGKAVNCKKVWAIYAFLKWYEVFFLDKEV